MPSNASLKLVFNAIPLNLVSQILVLNTSFQVLIPVWSHTTIYLILPLTLGAGTYHSSMREMSYTLKRSPGCPEIISVNPLILMHKDNSDFPINLTCLWTVVGTLQAWGVQ